MNYIKSFRLFLEEVNFNVLPNDSADVKKSKEYLASVQSDIQEYNKKKSILDSIFNNLNLDDKGIEKEVSSKVFVGPKSLRRNKYLVHYMNICQDNRSKNKILDSISKERINQSDYRELLSQAEDNNTKKTLQDKINDSNIKISEDSKKIIDIDKRISTNKKSLNDQMKMDIDKIKKSIEKLEKDRMLDNKL